MSDDFNQMAKGEICWLEVPCTNPSRAAAFYTAILGWKCNDKAMPSPDPGVENIYMFSHGRLNGSFLKMAESDIVTVADAARPERLAVLSTYCVDDVAESLSKIEAAGGKVHVPRTAIGGDMGFFARFIDTEGNLQGIWAAK